MNGVRLSARLILGAALVLVSVNAAELNVDLTKEQVGRPPVTVTMPSDLVRSGASPAGTAVGAVMDWASAGATHQAEVAPNASDIRIRWFMDSFSDGPQAGRN